MRKQQAVATETVVESPAQIKIPDMPGYQLRAMKEAIQAVLDGVTLNLGLDVGYGLTKALAWGFDPVLFRTLYGYERDLGYDKIKIMQRHPGESIFMADEGDFFVGDLAATQLRVEEQLTLAGRDNSNDIRRLMMLVALGKMFPDVYRDEPIKVRVVTGLPVKHMKGANDLKLALRGRHLIHTDQCKFVVQVVAVSVMPQPEGTLNAFSMNPDGSENPFWTFHKAAVVDNGQLSVDIATQMDGEYLEAESGTIETGMDTAYKRLVEHYNNEFGEFPSYRTIERIIQGKGKFTANREAQDWTREVEDVLRPMRSATLNLCRDVLRKASEHEFIANIGGPAPIVHSLIAKEYKGVIMPEMAQITNARGYLHYGGLIASIASDDE